MDLWIDVKINPLTSINVVSGFPVFSFTISLNFCRNPLPAFHPNLLNILGRNDHLPHQLSVIETKIHGCLTNFRALTHRNFYLVTSNYMRNYLIEMN